MPATRQQKEDDERAGRRRELLWPWRRRGPAEQAALAKQGAGETASDAVVVAAPGSRCVDAVRPIPETAKSVPTNPPVLRGGSLTDNGWSSGYQGLD